MTLLYMESFNRSELRPWHLYILSTNTATNAALEWASATVQWPQVRPRRRSPVRMGGGMRARKRRALHAR